MDATELSLAAEIDIAHAEVLIEPMNAAIQQADLNTPARIAAFIAQCGHESDSFKFMEENLNYKAESLCRVWPSHFNEENAAEYAHRPQAIADRAYANRMGNGPEGSGDGWNYRGRGWLQTTGKNGYEELSQVTGIDFVSNPDAVGTPEGAAISAAVFWKKHNLNHYVDNNDFTELTRKINGGTIGLEDRLARFQTAMTALS